MKKNLLAGIILSFTATSASAHPGFSQVEMTAGDYHTAELRITHGCNGSPTHTVTVSIPEGVMSVKPRVLSGWDMKIASAKLDKPISHHGVEVKEVVKTITWSGNSLPDNMFELFEIRFMTPDKPGIRLDFPLTQICDKGEIRWHEIAGPDEDPLDFNRRAPYIMLMPKPSGHSH